MPTFSPAAISRLGLASALWALTAGLRRRQRASTGCQSLLSSWQAPTRQLGICSHEVSQLFVTVRAGRRASTLKARVGALKVYLEWLKTRYGLQFFTRPEHLLDYPGHPLRQIVSRILGKLHSPVKTMTVARATNTDNTFDGCTCRPVKIMSFFLDAFKIC